VVHVGNWQLPPDRVGIDNWFMCGNGKSGSRLTNNNWRARGRSKLTCGSGRTGGVNWNWNWNQTGGNWAGDWIRDRDGNGNWNWNILSSKWEGNSGYSLFRGMDQLFNGLCNGLFHWLSNLNS
jgi:hypothetical protein